MSITDPMSDDTKNKILNWLLQQGVSTVLLCAILGFMGYGIIWIVPSHLELIQRGYEKNASQFTDALDNVVAAHERDREMFLRMLDSRYVNKQGIQ